MKINISKYVQILYEALEGKTEGEVKKIVANFIKLLSSNNQLRYKARIVAKFEELYNKKNGIVGVDVISREKLDERNIGQIKDFFKKRIGVSKVELKNKLNSKMIGGVVIRSNEEMVDASIDRQLSKMSNVLKY